MKIPTSVGICGVAQTKGWYSTGTAVACLLLPPLIYFKQYLSLIEHCQ